MIIILSLFIFRPLQWLSTKSTAMQSWQGVSFYLIICLYLLRIVMHLWLSYFLYLNEPTLYTCGNYFNLFSSRRVLALVDLNEPNVIQRKSTRGAGGKSCNKFDVKAVEWNPTLELHNYLALAVSKWVYLPGQNACIPILSLMLLYISISRLLKVIKYKYICTFSTS